MTPDKGVRGWPKNGKALGNTLHQFWGMKCLNSKPRFQFFRYHDPLAVCVTLNAISKQEKLEKLSKENAELRDLCLFLNQMSGSTTSGSSIPTSTAASGPRLHSTESDHPYAVHAACVTEVNTALTGGDPPKYTGFTGDARLEDMKQHETEGIKDKNQCEWESSYRHLQWARP